MEGDDMVYVKAVLAGLAALLVLSALTLAVISVASPVGARLLSSSGGLVYVILLSVAVSFWTSRKGQDQDTRHAGFVALATGSFAGLACVVGLKAFSFLPLAETYARPLSALVVGMSIISAQVFASFVRRRRPS